MGSEGPNLRELARRVVAGEESAAGMAEGVSERVERLDRGPGGLHAFLSHHPDRLRGEAEELEGRLAKVRGTPAGEAGAALPLAGVPVAIKDNLATVGLPTTCGSRMLDGYLSPYEATVVRRLRAAGALIAGKTNLDEFAMGSSTEHSAFGPTLNPHDPERVPGGSSGGSAAAVAAGLVPVALGSDTGGSIRQPAAFCGVVGLRPTYGAVSRYGLVAFGSSLDQVGTFGRTVEDAAALLQVIMGGDPLDSTAVDRVPPDLAEAARTGGGADHSLAGIVVGVPDQYYPPELDIGVRERLEAARDALASRGAEIRRLSLPHTEHAVPSYYVIAPAEASSNLARYDGIRFGSRAAPGADADAAAGDRLRQTRTAGFGAEVRRRIMLGTFALSTGYRDRYYGRAQAVRRQITRELREAFRSGVHALLTPTTPGLPFRFGDRLADPYSMYREDMFTVPASLAGLPAASVPVGRVQGLPVGAQLIGDAWEEPLLVRVAAALERAVSHT